MKYISDSTKHQITHSKDNKLKSFIDFEGRAKELPISYSAFEKTILNVFLSSKKVLTTSISDKVDEGKNPRQIEQQQLIRLLNIIAEEVYIDKFNVEIGVYQIEKKIIQRKGDNFSDNHLTAYRISKEEIMFNWVKYLKKVIENYLSNVGVMFDSASAFQREFDEQLWTNLRVFIKNLVMLPLWKNRDLSSTVFAGKKNYDYWKQIFETGKSPDGVSVLVKPLNFVDMIRQN